MFMDDSYQESKEEILAGAIEDVIADTGMWTKEESFYIDNSPYPSHNCSNCMFYLPVRNGVCDVILEEDISPQGYCRFYVQDEEESIELSISNIEIDNNHPALTTGLLIRDKLPLKEFEIETLIENTFLLCKESHE